MEASPRGLVPAIKNGTFSISDSMVCLEYLDDAFPDSLHRILPSTANDRARARYWCMYANEKIIPQFYRMLMRPDLDGQEQAKKDLHGMPHSSLNCHISYDQLTYCMRFR